MAAHVGGPVEVQHHHGGEVVRLSQLLERSETDLFETRAELEAKVCLKSSTCRTDSLHHS